MRRQLAITAAVLFTALGSAYGNVLSSTAYDDSVARDGQVALITQADSISRFDQFEIKPLRAAKSTSVD